MEADCSEMRDFDEHDCLTRPACTHHENHLRLDLPDVFSLVMRLMPIVETWHDRRYCASFLFFGWLTSGHCAPFSFTSQMSQKGEAGGPELTIVHP